MTCSTILEYVQFSGRENYVLPFFDTFGDSIQKCIHSVLGDRSSNSYGERGRVRLEGGGLRTPVP